MILDISCPEKILNYANKAAILDEIANVAFLQVLYQIILMMSSSKHVNVLEKISYFTLTKQLLHIS